MQCLLSQLVHILLCLPTLQRRCFFSQCVNAPNQFYHCVISELVLAGVQKKNEGCVATTVACFSSSINPCLNQWGRVLTLQSSQSVWELERDASSAGGPTEWRVERRRCGMKTEVLEGRDGWKQSKLIEGKQTSRETASIRGRSVNASDLQFGKFNSAEVVLQKI